VRDYVVLSGEHLYDVNLAALVAEHRRTGAALTIAAGEGLRGRGQMGFDRVKAHSLQVGERYMASRSGPEASKATQQPPVTEYVLLATYWHHPHPANDANTYGVNKNRPPLTRAVWMLPRCFALCAQRPWPWTTRR
jgi:hypothetical protein